MSTMSITISGVPVSVKNQAFRLDDAADKRSVLTFTVIDPVAGSSFVRGQPVVVTDSVLGVLYSGFVSKSQPNKLSPDPTVPNVEHAITCMDKHYLADKRVNVTNYINWNGGDIICDFINQKLSAEGVTGAFAQRADYTQASFAQGTLAGTAATSNAVPLVTAPQTNVMPSTANTGDLELATAGSTVTIKEQTTADFGSGTLTNMAAGSLGLSPTTQSALKMVADFPLIGTPNTGATAPIVMGNYTQSPETLLSTAYAQIWSGSQVIGSNDTFNYDVWIASTSPAMMAGVDFLCNDGTQLTAQIGQVNTNLTIGLFDQAGRSVDAFYDLTTAAKDTWYTRTIALTGLNGKTITSVSVFLAGGVVGYYTAYVKNCYLGSVPNSPFFSTSATVPQLNPPTMTVIGGYVAASVAASVVSVYNPLTSSRISPAYSISAVGLVRNSVVTWTASLPTNGPSVSPAVSPYVTSSANTIPPANTAPTMVLLASYDGTTWLPCATNAPLPGLPAGANVSGLSLTLQEQFASGSDPSAIPALTLLSITINSAANQSTSDVTAAYGNATGWNSGTYNATGLSGNNQLTLGTYTKNWSNHLITGQTFATFGPTLPTQSAASGAYAISAVGGNGASINYAYSRFDWLGFAANFTAEWDMQVSAATIASIYFCYRISAWNSNPLIGANLFPHTGYTVALYQASGQAEILMSGAGITQAWSYATSYHFKLVVIGNRHTLYFNHASTPTLDFFDNSSLAAGGFGFLAESTVGAGASATGQINNLSITTLDAGTWTSPAISLSALGTCGNAQVSWSEQNQAGVPQSTALVFASLDGGTTWQPCANGVIASPTVAGIPGLLAGTNVSGKSLQIQIVLFSNSPLATPIITGLYVRVCGFYGIVTGTRISPVLSLTPVGRIASSTVAWNANTPNGTACSVAVAQNNVMFYACRAFGSTFVYAGSGTDVTATNRGTLPGYYHQPGPEIDTFGSDSHLAYLNTNIGGGAVSTWTYDTPNSRLTASGGTGGLFIFSALWMGRALASSIRYTGNPVQYGEPNHSDVDLFVDMDKSDAGGLVWRFVDQNNYYELGAYDDTSSGGFTNQLRLYKVLGGVRSLLGSASTISWPRSTAGQTPYRRIRVTMMGAVISVYFDGVLMQTFTDGSPLGAGNCGLRNDGGTSRYYQLRVQFLGDSVIGLNLYTKVTLSTTDPAQMPQLFVLVASVRGAGIASGLAVPQMHSPNLPFAQYIAKEMDSLVQASGDYYWLIDVNGLLWFQQRLASPAPWLLSSADINMLSTPTVTPTSAADLYRNGQYITGVMKLVPVTNEPHVADGTATSWQMTYPVFSAPTVLSNGIPKSIGVQGIDTGKDLYWQAGSASITQDVTAAKIPAGTLMLYSYVGQQPQQVNQNNTVEQTARAAVETGTSGIIEEIEAAPTSFLSNMTVDTGTTWAKGLLARYGTNNTIEVVATTRRYGLLPGMITGVFIPEFNYNNLQLPIVRVVTQAEQQNDGNVYYTYQVTASNGPNLSSWASVWF